MGGVEERSMPSMCPKCGCEVVRIHRNWIDHVIDEFVPVHRYRCSNASCLWEGRCRSSTRDRARSKWFYGAIALLVVLGLFVAIQVLSWIDAASQPSHPRKIESH